jgi:L-seryl-tRNA(Ser) seleniumtransferase
MDSKPKFRQLPSVDKLLSDKRVRQLCQTFPRWVVVDIIRRRLAEIRWSITQGGLAPPFDEVIDSVVTKARNLERLSLQPVINATGTILHTNLGRAPLSLEAIRSMELVSQGYSNLELDLDGGKRGSRQAHTEQLLCYLTGAEDAIVVNNNASGVLLALSAMARRKEVIVSRGQAVEIGGGFRIPEVLRQSGAKLVEVGTTNCTYPVDYEQAITPRTSALLRVHLSNFKITGFTYSVSLEGLVELGQRYSLPVLDDLGSGCLIDTTKFGLDPEPKVQDSIAAGVTLAFFSGDKLLGGPQAGIIVGRKVAIEKLKRHPLARAVRIDKIRLAGLAATLVHYIKGEAMEKIPVLQFIATPLKVIEGRAERWAQVIGDVATTIPGESLVGGGSLPGNTLPTRLVAIRLREAKIRDLARNIRRCQPSVIGRVEQNTLLLDPRCVLPNEEEAMLKVIRDELATFNIVD